MTKWKFKQLLLKIAIALLALTIATTTIKTYYTSQQTEPIRVIQQDETTTSSQFIISKDYILGELKSKKQIVSYGRDLKEVSFTHVDDSWLGERHTEINLQGTYKMGVETKDIQITHIDNSGVVHVKLPKPVLISLELPFDKIDFDKTKGWLRLAMDEQEQKNFYSAVEKSIVNDMIMNKESLEIANIFNQKAVREIIMEFSPTVKWVVFE